MLGLKLNSTAKEPEDQGLVLSRGGYLSSGANATGEVIIPEGVKSITGKAFHDNTRITKVVIPSSCVKIGYYSFAGCTSLREVVIPDSVTYIDAGAFFRCTSLKKIVIPSSNQYILKETFRSCTSLEYVELPEGLSDIMEGAFSRCFSLRSIRLPSSVEVIQKYAFENCKNLADINMPAGLREIRSFAFKNCKSLKPFELPQSIESISLDAFEGVPASSEIIQNSTIKKDGMSIIGFTVISGQDCSGRVSVPEGIKTLGVRSFSDNAEVTSLELPSSFLRAELFSLMRCDRLADMILPLHYVRFDNAFVSLPALQSIRFSEEDPILRRPYGRVDNLDLILGSMTAEAFEMTEYPPHTLEYICQNPGIRMVFVALFMLLFIRNPDNSRVRCVIFENLLVFLEDAGRYGDSAFLSVLAGTPGFRESLDNTIAELSRKKEHDAVAFLMDFKSKRLGFRSIEPEDDDLI